MKKLLFLACLLVLPAVSMAKVHKCKVGGKTVYQQQPCDADDAHIFSSNKPTYDDSPKEKPERSYHRERAKRDTEQISYEEQLLRDAEVKDLKADVRHARDRIKAIKAERNAKLRILRAKKRQAMNNHAGAEWESSISQEMDAISRRYDSDLDIANDELKDARQVLRDYLSEEKERLRDEGLRLRD